MKYVFPGLQRLRTLLLYLIKLETKASNFPRSELLLKISFRTAKKAGEFSATSDRISRPIKSCVLQSRRSCCRDGYWTKQSIGGCVMWPTRRPHTWVSGWAPVACPVGQAIDPGSSGWTIGPSDEHSDRLLTYGQVAPPVKMCPWSTHRYYTDQYKPAAAPPPPALTVLKMHYTPRRQRRQFPASFARCWRPSRYAALMSTFAGNVMAAAIM